MYLSAEKKEELFSQYGKSNKDTGSAESQIALFSYRINHLTEHLKANHKDFGTQKALIKLVRFPKPGDNRACFYPPSSLRKRIPLKHFIFNR